VLRVLKGEVEGRVWCSGGGTVVKVFVDKGFTSESLLRILGELLRV